MLDPSLSENEPLVPRGSDHWPYPEEYHVRCHARGLLGLPCSHDTQNVTDQIVKVDETETVLYRHHRLRSCASPVKGLTADILVRTRGRHDVQGSRVLMVVPTDSCRGYRL